MGLAEEFVHGCPVKESDVSADVAAFDVGGMVPSGTAGGGRGAHPHDEVDGCDGGTFAETRPGLDEREIGGTAARALGTEDGTAFGLGIRQGWGIGLEM